MAELFKRTETININEEKRRSGSSSQWLLENQRATHPICDNSHLQVFICGEEGFGDIAKEIEAAKESIDICCWGFDPGMELVRNSGGCWPRGPAYGDLLIAAGKRGVNVRLLIWYDPYADNIDSKNPRNMPGYTHDNNRSAYNDHMLTGEFVKTLSAASCIARRVAWEAEFKVTLTDTRRHLAARKDYCRAWYWAAFGGMLKGIQIRTRAGQTSNVKKSLKQQPQQRSILSVEDVGLKHMGTHHQKPVLVDFNYKNGEKAVGYVMGLNSVTDYWDTVQHLYEDPRRELESARSYLPDAGHRTMKPYRDYACRIDRGRALLPLYQNFIKAWERVAPHGAPSGKSELGSRPIPEHCLTRGAVGSFPMQIVRTQPEEQDKTIQDIYFNATDLATRAAGYLYVENQYFQWEEWAQRLLRVRKQSMKQWNASRAAAGLTLESMPVLHVFIVIPVPEQEGMIPRTYDTLASLGQQDHMAGQLGLIEKANKRQTTLRAADGFGPASTVKSPLPEVVEHANQIVKQDAIKLESQFGIKVCTAMLNSCGSNGKSFDYREIYIHSKLLLVDDTFFTLGSGNMNLRSMAADSEINVATVDPDRAADFAEADLGTTER